MVRSSTRRALALGLALAVLAATGGCIGGSADTTAQLDASEGSGDLVVFLTVEEGQLTRADAWWAEDAPELDVNVDGTGTGLEALVLKNDVVVTRAPLVGSGERAVLAWRSADAGTTAQVGDTFEILVVDTASDDTVAAYQLAIEG
jgi:hypothetical protein